MSKVVVLAKVRSAAGKRAELAKEFGAALAEVENEPGTLTYVLHEDAKDEDLLWFYEVYTDEDAFKAIDKEIRAVVNEAASFAQDSPEPEPDELYTDVYLDA